MQPSAQSAHWCSILGYALHPQVLYLCSSQEPRSIAHTWCHTCGQPSGEQAWMTYNSTGTVSGLVPLPRQPRKAWRTRLSRRWADGAYKTYIRIPRANVTFHLLFFSAFNDCCLHKDGFLKAPPPEDPPTAEIEETTGTGAVGGAETGESGRERRLFPLRGAHLS